LESENDRHLGTEEVQYIEMRVLASGRPNGHLHLDARTCTPFDMPHVGPTAPEHHPHWEEGEGRRRRRIRCPTGAGRRRHRDEAEKAKRDAISNLLLKHLHTTLAHICLKTDETLEIYVRNTYKNNWEALETIINIRNIQIKHLQHMYKIYATSR
jgi:hypothetical protein